LLSASVKQFEPCQTIYILDECDDK
jgi:hypothetical protein